MTLTTVYPLGPDWPLYLPASPHTPRPAPTSPGAGRGHQTTDTYRPCAGCDSVGDSCRAIGCPASPGSDTP